jgi:hypothetical protein
MKYIIFMPMAEGEKNPGAKNQNEPEKSHQQPSRQRRRDMSFAPLKI